VRLPRARSAGRKASAMNRRMPFAASAIPGIQLWSTITMAETFNFDADAVGKVPAGWIAGVTGQGAYRWSVEADASAPSQPNVLKQSGRGDFPWCVRRGISIADGHVEARFKPIAGTEDQAGGVVWRWKDGGHYYVARANALENNVSLYYAQAGRRITIKYVDAPVAGDKWHALRVEFSGTHIRVALDGKIYIDIDDDHIAGAGAVGVWTKADSVTLFDDFAYAAKGAR
jgi:hypothetical protein